MKIKTIYVIISFLLMIQQVNSSSYYKILDYDDVRKEGGFKSPCLKYVGEIIPSGKQLTKEEKSDLINTKDLTNLRALSLEGQGIDDQFIMSLSKNESLKRLINLDLSKNEKITNESIEAILESDILGSIMDLPQISGRYGIPSSVIYIKAKETGVIPSERNGSYFKVHRFGFNISYIHPVKGTETSPPVEDGVKIVEIVLD